MLFRSGTPVAKAVYWTITDAETRKRGEQTGLDTLVLDLLKIVSLTDEEVVGVVRGSNLDAARTKADLNVIVGNDGDLSANDGEDQGLADEVLHVLVLGVDRDGSVTEHGLGTGGGNLNVCCKIIVPLWIETRTAYKRVINVRTRLYAVCLSLSIFSSVAHFRCRLHF